MNEVIGCVQMKRKQLFGFRGKNLAKSRLRGRHHYCKAFYNDLLFRKIFRKNIAKILRRETEGKKQRKRQRGTERKVETAGEAQIGIRAEFHFENIPANLRRDVSIFHINETVHFAKFCV